MAGQILQFIKGSKASTSGTYAEDEIQMPESKGSLLPCIKMVAVEHPKMADLADKYSQWHLSIKSEDAVLEIDDENCIEGSQRHAATNGAPVGVEDTIERIIYPFPIPVSRDKIYFGCYQDTAAGHTYRYKIGYIPYYVKGVVQQKSMMSIDF
jgi:hypothetical protein